MQIASTTVEKSGQDITGRNFHFRHNLQDDDYLLLVVEVGEDDVSREVFLVDLSWGRFMNSNSEVTDTVDFPDLAWLALDRGDTRVTLIGIF